MKSKWRSPEIWSIFHHVFLIAFSLIAQDYLVYFHAKDAIWSKQRFVPVGEGDGEVESIIRDLADSRWEGFVSVEPHLGPYMPDASGAECFRTALKALRGILQKV